MNRVQPAEAPPAIRRMLAVSRFRQFLPKQVIINQGRTAEHVFYMLKGSVAAETWDENGQRLVFHYITAGEFFGEMCLFEDNLKRSANVVARTACEVAMIELETFRQLIKDDPELLMELSRQLANRVRKTTEKLSNLAFLDVTGRVARTLIDLAEDPEAITHPDGKMIKITREELGRLVNCSREMAGQVLHTLEEQRLIQLDGRKIIIHPVRLGGRPES